MFDANRRFLDIGTFEFSSKLDVKNTRGFPTIAKFQIVDLETDLPIVDMKYDVDLRSNRLIEGRDKLKLEPMGWIENLHFKSEFQIFLQPFEERLSEIRQASYFRLKVRAIQSDNGGCHDFNIEVPNPVDELEKEITKPIVNWINHPINRSGAAGGGDIINYLRLLWKG